MFLWSGMILTLLAWFLDALAVFSLLWFENIIKNDSLVQILCSWIQRSISLSFGHIRFNQSLGSIVQTDLILVLFGSQIIVVCIFLFLFLVFKSRNQNLQNKSIIYATKVSVNYFKQVD